MKVKLTPVTEIYDLIYVVLILSSIHHATNTGQGINQNHSTYN